MNILRLVIITAVLFLFAGTPGCYKYDMPLQQVVHAAVENTENRFYLSSSDPYYDPGDHPVRISAKISKDISPEKIVFITVDDGPSDITKGFLETLKSHGVSATFFILGNKVRYYQEIVKRMYDEGHSVINHSYDHNYRYIYSSPQALISSMEMCNAEIDSVIQRTDIEKSFFRFPGGAGMVFARGARWAFARALSSNGYHTMEWNASTQDSVPGKITVESIRNNAIDDKGRDVIVVLMHDTNYRSSTLEALPHIIKHYKDKGYIFRTIRDMNRIDLQRLLDKGIVNVLY